MKITHIPACIFFGLASLLANPSQAQTGVAWSATTNAFPSSFGNLHPRLVASGEGNTAYLIWGKGTANAAWFSRWDGETFSTPKRLNSDFLPVASAHWMGPDLAARGDTVYIVVKEAPESDNSRQVYLIRSFDGGETFLDPVRVTFIADSVARFPAVTIDPQGHPIVGFMKFNSSYGDSRWAVTRSDDHGETFLPDVKASGWRGAQEICDCCPGAILADADRCVMLYRNNDDNLRDAWAGISIDLGRTFVEGVNVDEHEWLVNSCPASGPDGVIIGDTLYSVFLNGSGGARCYLSKTCLSDRTVVQSGILADNVQGLSSQNYPRIDYRGPAVAVGWYQRVNGQGQIAFRYTPDIRTDFPMAWDTLAFSNGVNVDLALMDSTALVVWQDDATGTLKFRKGTLPSVTTSTTDQPLPDAITVVPNPSEDEWIVTGYWPTGAPNACLYDVNAQVLRNPVVNFMDGHFSIRIPRLQLPAGQYFLVLSLGADQRTVRLIAR